MDAKIVLARMLAGRGFWIAISVAAGGLYSAWRSRTRRDGLRKLMRVRSANFAEKPTRSVGVALVRHQLETLVGFELPYLKSEDRVSELLNWDQSRRLVEDLEVRFDTALPDVRTVRRFTLAELGRRVSLTNQARNE